MIRGLSVKGLSVQRGERILFRDLAFDLAAGEAIALTGANGSGKTSLLRVIAGLLRPAAGEIVFEGAVEADVARHESVHLLGHADGLKGGRTALEELSFQAGWLGGDDEGVARAIADLALTPLLDLEVRRLSAGQRRRLAMARLIAAPRPLWLLDEPMAPLDTARRALLARMMQAHLAGGGLILAAVHDPLPIPARVLEIGA